MMYRFVVFIIRIVLSIFFKHKTEYTYPPELLPKGVIIAPNHASYLDPPLVAASWKGELHFFAGAHLFKKSFLGFLLPKINCHPVVPGKERATIRQAVDLLKQGKKVVLFPEGTRSKDGRLLALKTGVAYISLLTGCPIVPCYVEGTHDAWPKGKRLPQLSRLPLLCRFGNPLFADVTKESKELLTERLEKALTQLSTSEVV